MGSIIRDYANWDLWYRHVTTRTLTHGDKSRPNDIYMRHLINHHSFRQWLVAWSAPSHHLDQWVLLFEPLGTKFSEILIEIHTFSFKKMHLKIAVCNMADILSRPQCVKHGTCFPIDLREARENLFCYNWEFNVPIRSQVCTPHESSTVATGVQFWPDLIIIIHARTRHNFISFWIVSSKCVCEMGPSYTFITIFFPLWRLVMLTSILYQCANSNFI